VTGAERLAAAAAFTVEIQPTIQQLVRHYQAILGARPLAPDELADYHLLMYVLHRVGSDPQRIIDDPN
jgi:hypothetical protein